MPQRGERMASLSPLAMTNLERDDFSSNRHPALSFCLSMISAQTLRVCREGKPVPTFPDHALETSKSNPATSRSPDPVSPQNLPMGKPKPRSDSPDVAVTQIRGLPGGELILALEGAQPVLGEG